MKRAILAIGAALLATAAWSAVARDRASAAQDASERAFELTVRAPGLFVEGEPWPLTVEVSSKSGRAVDVPAWTLSPGVVQLDGRPLVPRGEATFPLAPGQRVTSALDLASLITFQGTEPGSSLRLEAPFGAAPVQVMALRRAETGIDFMQLPLEQLADYQVVLRTDSGVLWLDLWPDVAPNHVRNFLDLAYSGFYDGSKFHRVIPGFMLQGGRAYDGREPPRTVKAEFSTRRHDPGVLSAARQDGAVDSATSEFFLVHKASPHLDGQYSAFGALVASFPENDVTVEKIIAAVEGNYSLLNELKRVAPIDMQQLPVQIAVSTPRPPQHIQKAIVVKKPRLR